MPPELLKLALKSEGNWEVTRRHNIPFGGPSIITKVPQAGHTNQVRASAIRLETIVNI